jgi:hypothetical protein
MSSQPIWITPAGSQGVYPEGQPLSIQFQAIPSDQSSGRVANVLLGQIKNISVTSGGAGYVSATPPSVTVTPAIGDTTGSGGEGIAFVDNITGKVSRIIISDFGNNYTLPPTITLSSPPSTSVISIAVDVAGSGYTDIPLVSISANTGLGATATARIDANVSSMLINDAGANYEFSPAIDIVGGDNKIKAVATTTISAVVDYIEVVNSIQYTTPPIVVIAGGGGDDAVAEAILDDDGYLTAILVVDGGSSYNTEPFVLVDGQDGQARAHISGVVDNIILERQGSEYTSVPTVTITGGGGSGAAFTAAVGDGQVQSLTLVSSGSGYKEAPQVSFAGGGVNTATAEASIIGSIASISVTAIGIGYTQANTSITFTGGGGSGLAATPVINAAGSLVAITITNPGSGYTSDPIVNIISTDLAPTGAAARTRLSATLNSISITSRGNGYKSKPTADVIGGFGSDAIITPIIDATISNIDVVTQGTGYLSSPLPTISIIPIANATGGNDLPFVGSGAVATATVAGQVATAVSTTNRGQGYSTIPKVTITPAPGDITGGGATATATISSNAVSQITVLTRGAGYTLNPIVTVEAPIPLQKLTTSTTTNSNIITVNNTTNIAAGMTVSISNVIYDVLLIDGLNVTIDRNVTVILGSVITFYGITATPTSTIEATPVLYKLQSGSLPIGTNTSPVRLTTAGLLTGTPAEVSVTTTSEFTLRAIDTLGNIKDRVFSVGIQGPDVPLFLTNPGTIISVNDSIWIEFQVLYITPDPIDVVITVDSGTLPPGLTISSKGLITGYADPPLDVYGQAIVETYTFVLRATKVNTTQSSTRSFSITVRNQDEGVLTRRVPAILNNNPLTPIPQANDPYFDFYFSGFNIGTFRHDNYFAYKLIGYDFDAAGGSIQSGVVTSVSVVNGGAGYTTAPSVTIVRRAPDTTGTGATATALISGGVVTAIIINNGGYNFTETPNVVIAPPPVGVPGRIQATAVSSLDSIRVTRSGSGYLTAPTVTISAPDFINGTPAGATAVINSSGQVTRIVTNSIGAGYTELPTIIIDPPPSYTRSVTNSTLGTVLTITNTLNIITGMTVTGIPGANQVVTVVSVTPNTSVTVSIEVAAFAATDLTFQGIPATADLTLSIQYQLNGVQVINGSGSASTLTFDPFTGWLSGNLPNIGPRVSTYQLTAYVLKNNLISVAYNYNITIQGDVTNTITWSTTNDLLGTLVNGEVSYLGVSAVSTSTALEYRLAPLVTKDLNAITWGALTKTASTTTDTTGSPSFFIGINPSQITSIRIGSTVTGSGITSTYPTVVEIDLILNRIRFSSQQAIALGTTLTFTTNAYVAVGNGGVIQYALVTQNSWFIANTATSSSGYSTLANFNGVVFSDSLQQFITVGDLSGAPVLFISYNAVDWYQSPQIFNSSFNAIALGYPVISSVVTPTLVAVCTNGQIWIGTDPLALNFTTSGITSNLTSVTWDDFNKQFVAVSDQGDIITSTTGQTWTSQTVSFPVTYGSPPNNLPVRYVKVISPAVTDSNVLTLNNVTDLTTSMITTIDDIVRTIISIDSVAVTVTIDGPTVTLANNSSVAFDEPASEDTPYSFSLNSVAGAPRASITEIIVTNGGSNYTSVPTITFVGGGGSGAVARANLGTGGTVGQVISITLISTGSDYTSDPEVVITPAAGDTTGTGALASATVGSALLAVGSVRWLNTTTDMSLILASTDGGVNWIQQLVYNQPPNISLLGTLQNVLFSVIPNPTNPNYWLIGSTAGTIIEGTHTGTTDIAGTGDPQNNVASATVAGQWSYYQVATPYTILGLWADSPGTSIVTTPNILSCGTVGFIEQSTTGADEYTWSSINVQSLPYSLSLLPSGDISGRVAFVPTETELAVGTKTRYTFVVQAYSVDIRLRDVSTTKQFFIDITTVWTQPYETIYMKALPSEQGRNILGSLLSNTTLIPTRMVYRANDPYYGVANSIIYQQQFGVNASSLDQYIQAEQKNHYWRNLVLGELQVARALDPSGNVIYEVVYSAIQDNLVNAAGKSVSSVITWPEPITLSLGPWYNSITTSYDSYVYGDVTSVKTTSGCINNVVIPLNNTIGINIGQVVTGIGIVDINGSLQQNGKQNGAGNPTVVAVNDYSVTLNKAQTLVPNTFLRFQTPEYYTARTPGYAQTLYPASLPNMRSVIAANLGQNNSDTILPRWMTSQQTNGNTLGYVSAWVVCYVKPGFGTIVKDNIQRSWNHRLNEIDFTIDRFEVDKSATYNWDNNLVPPNWDQLPSSDQTSITDQSKDFYVLFPQKTILPTIPQ